MEGFFQQGIDQFIRYQKDLQGKKTRHQKKVQKIQKVTSELRDPQIRKQRHFQRRKQQKAKLQKQLEGMSIQEARVYLDNKKQTKKAARQRSLKALQKGIPILVDAVFQSQMNSKQNKSLAIQIQLIMKSIKHMQDPPGIFLCSVGGGFKTQLQKMRYQYWTLSSSSENVVQVAKKLNKNPIYLSPDAQNQLTQIDENAAYIIGGLVDRTIIKNASLRRAEQLNIPAVRLPISQYMKSRKCLNLDHVVNMINKFKQTQDWKAAFDFAVPKRWKKQQEGQAQTKQQNQDKKEQLNDSQSNKSAKQEEEDKRQKLELLNNDITIQVKEQQDQKKQ